VAGLIAGIFLSSSDELYIGAYYSFSNAIVNHYKGMIDELRVWSKVLTETEINQFMNSTLSGSENGLVLYLSFDNVAAGNDQTVTNDVTSGAALAGATNSTSSTTPSNVTSGCFLGLNEDLIAKMEHVVYPNPATDLINFEFLSDEIYEDLTLNIYDGLGRIVCSKQVASKKHTVSSSNFESGTYTYSISDREGKYSAHGKLVIIR
jgi:hypothetical protein